MKKFLISEEEKNRILVMHQDATKRHYLSEQGQPNVQPTTVDLNKIYNDNLKKIDTLLPPTLETLMTALKDISKPGLSTQQVFEYAQGWIKNNQKVVQLLTGQLTLPQSGAVYVPKFKPNAGQINSYVPAVKAIIEDVRDLKLALRAKSMDLSGKKGTYPQFFTTANGQRILPYYVEMAKLKGV